MYLWECFVITDTLIMFMKLFDKSKEESAISLSKKGNLCKK